MRLFASLCFFSPLILLGTLNVHGDVVINELNYNPFDDGPQEFIELYNPTDRLIDLEGYRFTNGILFEFPAGARIQAGGYAIVVQNQSHRGWRTLENRVLGQYSRRLSKSGERVTLRAPDGRIVDELRYTDLHPWPRGADGYGPSMERIDPHHPSTDPRNWRASDERNGTPAARNSTANERIAPFLWSHTHSPEHPSSNDEVTIEARFDDAAAIAFVTLYVQPFKTDDIGPMREYPMDLLRTEGDQAIFKGIIPPHPSQTLARFKFGVTLHDGETVYWPHRNDRRPFESYFVYDDEIDTLLSMVWMFHDQSFQLPQVSRGSGLVIAPKDGEVEVYDGAWIITSRPGQKMRFIKGEEYRGNRTINVMQERPTRGSSSQELSPFVEQMSFTLFAECGVLTPGTEWFRVIERGTHVQRVTYQQPNERFLELNQRDDSGNVYKIAYNNPLPIRNFRYEKQTNTDEPHDDLFEMVEAIWTTDMQRRAENVRRYIDYEKTLYHSVVSVFVGNWDGFFNNLFLYHNPAPLNIWEPIPWDCDKTFGYVEAHIPQFHEMPIDYPLNGQARQGARTPGILSHPFHSIPEHHEDFKRHLRHELDDRFSIDRMQARCDEFEQLLLDDLALMSGYTDASWRNRRRDDIINSYNYIMRFVHLRHVYLRERLPTSVLDWALME